MARRRHVRHGTRFLEEARRLFPPSGSVEGRPPFALFADTVLKAAELAFGSDFEGQLAETAGSPIRLVLTAQTPFFPQPLVFYGLLVAEDTVEIVDIVVDEDFWDTGDDPE